LKLAENEGKDFWIELFEELKRRALRGVKVVYQADIKG
jgi:transposase-like protein